MSTQVSGFCAREMRTNTSLQTVSLRLRLRSQNHREDYHGLASTVASGTTSYGIVQHSNTVALQGLQATRSNGYGSIEGKSLQCEAKIIVANWCKCHHYLL